MAKPAEKSQAEIDEEEALQLAISLSQSEADEKERQKKLLTQQYASASIPTPPTPLGSAPVADQVLVLIILLEEVATRQEKEIYLKHMFI